METNPDHKYKEKRLHLSRSNVWSIVEHGIIFTFFFVEV